MEAGADRRRKVFLVAGARPNFMKIAPVYREMRKYDDFFTPILVHTGQHYDANMSEKFFDDLKLPSPDIFMGIGSGTHAEQTAKIMIEFEKACIREKPQHVIVVGDVNSTMACAITAAKLSISVSHIEAGLRSGDRTMPEEINRLVTDSISDILLTPSQDADENLLREGHPKSHIFRVGNVMIDSLEFIRPQALEKATWRVMGLQERQYVLLTLHRPSNVDEPELLKKIIDRAASCSRGLKIIFPVHPRTKNILKLIGVTEHEKYKNIRLLDPLGYLDFISLMMNAKFVLTDSGGIQEETTFLGIPCLTLRDTTERPITVTHGTNQLVNLENVERYINDIMDNHGKEGKPIEFWDGCAAKRIVELFMTHIAA